MQQHARRKKLLHRPTFYLFLICIVGISLGICIAAIITGVQQVRTLQQHENWRKDVYQRKYNEAILKSLQATPTPTPKPKTAKVTAYSCGGIETEAERKMNCPNGISASGKPLVPFKTVACDRANMGRVFHLEGIGEVTCVDVGGAIKGAGRFDLYVTDIQTARQWGVQEISYMEVL